MRFLFNFLILLLLASPAAFSQFHTLKIPEASNAVQERQRLGVTDITISYHSPAVRGRDVWNDPYVIPQNGDPIPWRAGANMNTTIDFSTDVFIEGKPLKSGTYGFHIIPQDGQYVLLFAHNSQQWGSYYLDREKDVSLEVTVTDTATAFSEKLDYEFLPVGEDAMVIALEWADRRIPFRVTVNLAETVVASFRSELRGVNTYQWQAWDDAASWCMRHDTHLEEALTWADRSINGGYEGYAANKNFQNLTTKAQILEKLNRKEELAATISEIMEQPYQAYEANNLSLFLLSSGSYQLAFDFSEQALVNYPDVWYLPLNLSLCHYFLGNKKEALKGLTAAKPSTPEDFRDRLDEIIDEVERGIYQVPQR